MRRALIIAAVLIATRPVAHATTYLFTSGTVAASEITTGTGTYPITVWGYIFTSTLGTGSSIYLNGAAASNLSYNSTYGLGVGATSNEIVTGSPDSAVVFDFADPTPAPGGPKLHGVTTVTFHMDNLDSNWLIYGGNTAPAANSVTGLTKLYTSGNLQASQTISLVGYDYLVVTAGSTCELNILSIDVNTAAPEPGTSLMAGIALIGLSVALRKARKR